MRGLKVTLGTLYALALVAGSCWVVLTWAQTMARVVR